MVFSLWPRHLIRHRPVTLKLRFFGSTALPPSATYSRSVVLRNLKPNFNLSRFLDSTIHQGTLESIWADESKLILKFLHYKAARDLHERLGDRRAFQAVFGIPEPVPVETVAAVGLFNANRCLAIRRMKEHDITKEQLLERIHTFARTIEHVEFGPDGDSAIIHFMGIRDAQRVLLKITKDPPFKGLSVVYNTHERCDPAAAFPPSPQPEFYNSVRIRMIPYDTSVYSVLSRMKIGPVKSVDSHKGVFYIHFFDHESASEFLDTESWSILGPSVSAVANIHSPVKEHVERARQLGATRTVVITSKNFNDLRDLNIRANFNSFGKLYKVHFSQEQNAVFLLYQDIEHAMNAISRVSMIPDYSDFRAAGMTISFAPDADTAAVLPPLGGLLPFTPKKR